VIAERAGETDEEIPHVTGYTVPMIRAVLRSSWRTQFRFSHDGQRARARTSTTTRCG